MGDLDYIAKGILNSFTFDFNSYWKTYAVPTVSTLRAIQTLILGDSLFAWEVFQGVLLCSGLIWLAFEIKRLTNSKVLPLVLLFTVALSKSSVFWSLKLAREGAAEALMYLTIAALLAAMRTREILLVLANSKILLLFCGSFNDRFFFESFKCIVRFPSDDRSMVYSDRFAQSIQTTCVGFACRIKVIDRSLCGGSLYAVDALDGAILHVVFDSRATFYSSSILISVGTWRN